MVSRESIAVTGVTRVRAIRVIIPLLFLQADTAGLLWFLEATSQITEQIFALLLSVEMLAFAMTSYAYRNSRRYTSLSKAWIVVGCVALLLLLFSSLLISGS